MKPTSCECTPRQSGEPGIAQCQRPGIGTSRYATTTCGATSPSSISVPTTTTRKNRAQSGRSVDGTKSTNPIDGAWPPCAPKSMSTGGWYSTEFGISVQYPLSCEKRKPRAPKAGGKRTLELEALSRRNTSASLPEGRVSTCSRSMSKVEFTSSAGNSSRNSASPALRIGEHDHKGKERSKREAASRTESRHRRGFRSGGLLLGR